MVVRKKLTSKRLTSRHRAKVAKKVREHHRKLDREAKSGEGKKGGGKKRKDPGLPNSLPNKEEFIQKMQAEHEKEKEQRRLALERNDLSEMLARANAKQATHDKTQALADDAKSSKFYDSSKRAFYREFKHVVDHADVILEVLDARDPEGSRVRAVEEMVAASGGRKRVVLVLNKIDLVPRNVVTGWLNHFRRELPAVAFRASTSGSSVGAPVAMGECLGADTLIQLLKNYCRNQNIKTSVRVGVVGYPNVGKSSIINSLKRSKVCKVGATPGVTTSSQEIHLDRNITLLDCPGIVFASPTNSSETAQLFLRNCLKIEQLDDPIAPVELILQKSQPDTLMCLYNVPRFSNTLEFLNLVAQRMGKLKKGGTPNAEAAAKVILGDWNQGKIPFYTIPPAAPISTITDSTIVNDWAPEFDLDAIGDMEVEHVLSGVPVELSNFMPVIMDTDSIPSVSVSSTIPQQQVVDHNIRNLTKGKKDAVDYKVTMSAVETSINPQLNKDRARLMKQAKKAERKSHRVQFATTNDNCTMMVDHDNNNSDNGDDTYDFNRDFNRPQ